MTRHGYDLEIKVKNTVRVGSPDFRGMSCHGYNFAWVQVIQPPLIVMDKVAILYSKHKFDPCNIHPNIPYKGKLLPKGIVQKTKITLKYPK